MPFGCLHVSSKLAMRTELTIHLGQIEDICEQSHYWRDESDAARIAQLFIQHDTS